MSNRGNALMGTGRGNGPSRAIDAAQAAVSSPLLEDVSISGAEGVLVNITGGRDLTLHEVNEAAQIVTHAAGEEANVIFGSVIDPNLDGEIIITVVATGFGHHEPRLRLVDRGTARTETPADEEMARPRPWRREDTNGGQRPRTGVFGRKEAESLDVPAFLRRQMD
jgi:cell division protein FtsZ